MASILDQNFGDDDSDEGEDFNPQPADDSDAEEAGSDEEKSARPNNRTEARHEKSRTPGRSRKDANGNDSPEPTRANGRPARDGDEEDNGEDDEGEGEDLNGDDDEEEDDDEDEDIASSRPRKRRRRGLNQFFEEEAEVDEDDDDVEDDAEDLVADGFVADTHPDDLEELGPGVERDDRAHRLLDARLDLEASMDAERQAQELKERYGRRTQAGLNAGSFVPQNLLMPSVDDPSIWGISCKVGKEREIIMRIMKKLEDRHASRNPLKICSAFERGSGPMAGYIFVEARKKEHVDEALLNVADVYPRSKTNLVPVKEMPDLLRVTKTQELREDGYVRIKRGLYKDDLAMIQEVESNGLDVMVRLVPRLAYGLDEDDASSPMITNNLDGQAKRKRMNTFGTANSAANRPPQKLFNDAEAKKKHNKHVASERPLYGGIKAYRYRSEHYEDGFLIKNFRLNLLKTQDVNPRLDEITKLTRTMADGTEALDLESLAHSLRNNTAESSYMPGDEVEVYQGEQRGITGRTEAVQGNIVSIKITTGDLQGQIVDVPMKGLRKCFKEGDHVKVIGGSRYKDEVGMVIRIKDDRVTVLTDLSMTEITVFSKDLREATDSGGSSMVNKFDVQDLLQLDPSTVGIVLKADRESIRVLDQEGSVSMRLPSQITNKIEERRNAVSTDKNGAEIRIGDVVREAGGEGKTGTILHIHRSYLFLHNKTQIENSGLWTTRSMNVITTANKGGRIGAPSVDMTKMNPALQLKNGGMADMPPPRSGFDRLRGKKISIRKGPYKGNKGTVKDTTDTTARIELEAKNKVVNVPKDDLNVIDQMTGKSTDYRSFLGARGPPPGGMRTGGGFGGGFGGGSRIPDGGYGGRTPLPMDGGKTPSWGGGGSQTPGWGGGADMSSGKTPSWKGVGAATSYGGGNMTSYGGAGNYGAPAGGRTPAYGSSGGTAWSGSSRTPYGAEHGFSSNNNSSAFDSFTAGSRTPYGGAGTSRTPAWSGSSGTKDAPTPRFDALPPSAPTPRGVPDEDPYTPAPYTPYGAAAPTPGASGGGYESAPTPAFAKGSNKDPLKYNRLLDAPTPAGGAPTPSYGGYDAPTPAAGGGGPRYLEDDEE